MKGVALEAGVAVPRVESRHVPWTLAATMLMLHLAISGWVSARHGIPVAQQLTHWDSEHYTTIIESGYGGSMFAYLPLYPRLVAATRALISPGAPAQWVGAAFSLACFAVFVALAVQRRAPDDTFQITPRTHWGWFVFLFSPASYVFHTHHGESVFLLLSFLAFDLASRERWSGASVAAGFSVLARNQGVLVWLASAAVVWLRETRGAPGGRRALAGVLGIGFAFVIALLGIEWSLSGGNPLAHLDAQKNWRQAQSLAEVARSFWWGNPWQRLYLDSAIHHLLWFVLGFAALALRGQRLPLAVYTWASLWLMPLQAELINVYRYGAVLFPVWFLLGDWLGKAPAFVKWPLAAAWLWLNCEVTMNFALERWAY